MATEQAIIPLHLDVTTKNDLVILCVLCVDDVSYLEACLLTKPQQQVINLLLYLGCQSQLLSAWQFITGLEPMSSILDQLAMNSIIKR